MITPATLLLESQIVLPLGVVNLWYALPLVVSVSLVCAATRHEEMGTILNHAVRFGLWIVVFMAVVMALLTFMGWLA